MKRFQMIAVICLLVHVCYAQQNEKDVLAIKELNKVYTRAVELKDSITLKAIMTDQFVITSGNGTQRDRQDEISDLTAPGYKIQYFRIENERYFTYPDAAVVTGQLNWKMTNPSGQEMEVRRIFTTVYTRINNQWK